MSAIEPASTKTMLLNMGPSHPSTHGVIRITLELEGEKVLKADVEMGYLHRGFEKTCENVTYCQVVPYTDRLNYVSPLINNVGYCLAVEKLLGVDATERAKYIRVIMSELSRLTDHLTCIAANAMELGAFTVYFYFMQAREVLYEVIEKVTGHRLTVNYVRVGGLARDIYDGFEEDVRKAFVTVRGYIVDVEKLLSRNRIYYDRMREVSAISQDDAISLGFTGPCLRSTGVNYDVRKAHPYLVYDRMNFDVPLGDKGDNYDRYLVRIEEMRQSMRIVEQALKQIPQGPINISDPSIIMPPKKEVYGSIEGLMNQFKLVTEGIKPPKGEVYFSVEGGNGELGFYVVSDGTGRPYRVRVRPPCFLLLQGLSKMIVGGLVADIVATFGMINMIAGENDR